MKASTEAPLRGGKILTADGARRGLAGVRPAPTPEPAGEGGSRVRGQKGAPAGGGSSGAARRSKLYLTDLSRD